ncbi:metallo-beta-lactamase domain-containing protein 1-like [Ptychodera flava]|uniref:metallo-beta-lactamase domain-containing protein 1-like n=1 Tax=Ptychodera flava TaxID=63121 RepID=UPI00396A41D9
MAEEDSGASCHVYQVVVLKEGYSHCLENGDQVANGTISLVLGPHNIMVDTGNPWDGDDIIKGLSKHGLTPSNIDYVIATHGHVDHIGNLNLFKQATHIVGFDICNGDKYATHPFKDGSNYEIDEYVSVIPTPGHTHSDVSVIVKSTKLGTVVIAGDLFECMDDLKDPSIWQEVSENIELQEANRKKVLKIADVIIPGHGKMFQVTETKTQNT